MRRKSRSCCDFRYFLPKYFRYRLEKGASTVTWTFDFSLLMLTLSPKFPVLPSTLMRPSRNFSKSLVSMMLSEAGCSQSMVYFATPFLPLSAPAFFFRPLVTISLATEAELWSVLACSSLTERQNQGTTRESINQLRGAPTLAANKHAMPLYLRLLCKGISNLLHIP